MRAVILALLICLCGHIASAAELSFYCSNLEAQCRLIANGFERATGVRVAMIRKSTGEVYAQLKAEAESPRGDVWWGGTSETHQQAATEGLLQAYRSPQLEKLHPWFQRNATQAGFASTGVYVGAVGLGVNMDQLARRDLPVPRCWADLANPIYRGEIQMPDPRSSGTAYLFLSSILARFGEEKGWDYVKKLLANVNQLTKSGDAPVRALATGETSIAIAFLHGMTPEAVRGAPVRALLPCEGAGYEVIAVSLIKNGPNPEAARRFIDYALSAEAQSFNAELGIAAAPSRPDAKAAPGTPSLDQLGLSDTPRPASRDARARVLKRFEEIR